MKTSLSLFTAKKVEQIGGSFISSVDNGLKKYSIDATKLKAGEYIYCEIDGGLQTVDHELKVGDLIYSNGALASVDDNAPVSDDCVGVVYFVGNPMPSVLYPFTEDNEFTYSERQDALLRDHPGCTHGLVLGSNSAVRIPPAVTCAPSKPSTLTTGRAKSLAAPAIFRRSAGDRDATGSVSP